MDKTSNENSHRGKAVSAVVVIMAMTLITKILGFVREMALASRFGAGMETDAYKIALMVPAIIYASIEAVLSTTFIPVYLNMEEHKKRRFVNNLMTAVILVASVLTVLGILMAPVIIRLVAPGFDDETIALAVSLIRIIFPMIVFMGMSSLAGAYLQSHHHFLAPSMMAIPNNLIIIGTIIFAGTTGIYGLAVATVVGVLSQFILQYPVLKRYGYRYRPVLSLADPGLRRIGELAVPVILGTMVGQVNSLADKILASTLSSGNVSALDYANKINGMVLAMFSTSVVIVSYPRLSRLWADQKFADFRTFFRKSLQVIFFITFPVMISLVVLHVPVIRLLFERGAFDAEDSHLTSIALLFYSVGIPAAGAREVLNKTFYSLQDTRTPIFNSVIAVLLNISLNVILIRYMAIGGVALATSLSAVVSTIMLMFHLRKKIGTYGGRGLMLSFLRTCIAAGIMGMVLWGLENKLFHAGEAATQVEMLGKLAAEGILGIVVFLGASYLLGSQELREGLTLLESRIRKIRGVTG